MVVIVGLQPLLVYVGNPTEYLTRSGSYKGLSYGDLEFLQVE